MTFLETPIEYLKGVGPARAQLLQRELEVFTYEDMLMHFPFRYVDRSQISTISQISVESPYVVLKGIINNVHSVNSGRTARLSALFSDGTGTLELVWFQGVKWVMDSLKPNAEYVVMGRPSLYNGHINIAHPDLELVQYGDQPSSHLYIPVYPSTEKLKAKGLSSKGISKLTESILRQGEGKIPEVLPLNVIQHYHLPSREEALRMIHFPTNSREMSIATQRMKFEELFMLQLDYQYAKYQRRNVSQGRVFGIVGEKFNRFYSEKLPFELTGAQKRVIKEIRADMKSGHQMNRLLQGDVGSGKTLVALLCMLIAIDNGCQACLMAPTEILANQHYATISRFLEGLDVNVELLTGSLKPSQKKKIRTRLAAGEIDILIGTHALIEDSVQFQRLGFIVIDEQHRFGVEQRAKLWTKDVCPPHVLVMTATPIPRTLAMTLYGDLDCSVNDELPPGRHPVRTYHRLERNRPLVFSFLKQQIDAGRQVYIVYPLIEESEKMDLKNLQDGLEMVQSYFPRPQYQTSMVHGRLTAEEKAFEMDRFKRGLTHIMVATTVIEVGVDVPNASVMVIENAERFGLSQLHQLRGRVGRGADQAYCILMTKDGLSYTSQERIRTMCSTTDGFQIAEADLRLRGPGDIQGLQQSGALDLRLASIVDDEPLVSATRNAVRDLLAADPALAAHPLLMQHIQNSKNKILWGKIS